MTAAGGNYGVGANYGGLATLHGCRISGSYSDYSSDGPDYDSASCGHVNERGRIDCCDCCQGAVAAGGQCDLDWCDHQADRLHAEEQQRDREEDTCVRTEETHDGSPMSGRSTCGSCWRTIRGTDG